MHTGYLCRYLLWMYLLGKKDFVLQFKLKIVIVPGENVLPREQHLLRKIHFFQREREKTLYLSLKFRSITIECVNSMNVRGKGTSWREWEREVEKKRDEIEEERERETRGNLHNGINVTIIIIRYSWVPIDILW